MGRRPRLAMRLGATVLPPTRLGSLGWGGADPRRGFEALAPCSAETRRADPTSTHNAPIVHELQEHGTTEQTERMAIGRSGLGGLTEEAMAVWALRPQVMAQVMA